MVQPLRLISILDTYLRIHKSLHRKPEYAVMFDVIRKYLGKLTLE
jgi:hypothetical protein